MDSAPTVEELQTLLDKSTKENNELKDERSVNDNVVKNLQDDITSLEVSQSDAELKSENEKLKQELDAIKHEETKRRVSGYETGTVKYKRQKRVLE